MDDEEEDEGRSPISRKRRVCAWGDSGCGANGSPARDSSCMSWAAVAQIAVAISIGRGPVRRLFETVPRGRDQQTALNPPYGRLWGLDKRRDGMKGLFGREAHDELVMP
ncbi:hypothetical protein CPLU01_01266 [Colletotrichum plurivorum]|uniref:Uncharacterized protein n=1 Tax=Colletotrichum plurivorum TaxID=2175906 RepID=A0A8H6NPL4_9PEZI|nr:hypothetical protein CPLU01_01266 [Colletotrichum plurivorum]